MSPERAIHWLASLPYPIKTDGSNGYSELPTVHRAPCCPAAQGQRVPVCHHPALQVPLTCVDLGVTGVIRPYPIASCSPYFSPTWEGLAFHCNLDQWGPWLWLLGTKGVHINEGNLLPGLLIQLRSSKQGKFGRNSEGISPPKDTGDA